MTRPKISVILKNHDPFDKILSSWTPRMKSPKFNLHEIAEFDATTSTGEVPPPQSQSRCRNSNHLPQWPHAATIFVGQKWIGTLDEVQLHAEFVKEIVSE